VGRPVEDRIAAATQALPVARASGDANEIAFVLSNLGSCYRDERRFDEAEPLFVEACSAPEALSRICTNTILRNWAISDLQRGDVERARRRFTDVARLERFGSEAHASAMLNIGELEFAVGNVEAARAAARQAREIFSRLQASPLALVVCNLAAYAIAAEDYEEARSHLREALKVVKQSGTRWMPTALEHHAVLAGLLGDHDRAATLLGFTDAHYLTSHETRQTTEQHGYERLVRCLAEAYDEEELARRMNAGLRLTDKQALEIAVAISQEREHAPAASAAEKEH
jgi:tetratricopeptide (TPR) repeat protein